MAVAVEEKHQNALIALAVHAFTASGIVLAMLAAFAAYRLDWPEFFGWLGVALVVDGVDGPIARRFAVGGGCRPFRARRSISSSTT